MNLQTPTLEVFRHYTGRPRLLETQLRVFVKVPADGYEIIYV